MNSQPKHTTIHDVDFRGVDMNQLLDTLKSIMPVLDEIKNAVEHSSNKIPKASEQLTTVTQATETATMEILDFLDLMGQRVENVEGQLKAIQDELLLEEPMRVKLEELLRRISSPSFKRYAIRHYADKIRPMLETKMRGERIGSLCTQLADVRSISMNIAIALQVQDITSQQIDSVRHLIDNVRVSLSNVVGQYDGKEPVTHDHSISQKAFDGEALYTKDTSRQEDADSIIEQFNQIQFQQK